MIVVIVHAKNVCDTTLSIGPPRAGVEALRSRSSRQRRKWVHDIVRAARPVQPEIDVGLRTPPSSSATSTPAPDQERTGARPAGLPKIVNQPQNHCIGAILPASHVVRVLSGTRHGRA